MQSLGHSCLPEIQAFRWLRLILFLALIVFGTARPAPAMPLNSLDPGDTLIVGISAEDIFGLDPAIDTSLNMEVVTGQIYETLTTYDAGSAELVPGLASSWSASADLRDWTFTLRPGVTFQDGSPLNADAVRFNFERWWDPAHPYHGTNDYPFFSSIFRYRDDPSGSQISGIDVSPDNTQVIIHLSEPSSVLPQRLTLSAFAIASPQAIALGTLSDHPVGTGAYQFSTWDKTNHTIELAEYSGYWGEQPFIPNVVLHQIGDYEDQLEAIKANTLHVVYGIPNEYYESARQDINIHVTWQLETTLGYLGMNRTRGPLTSLLVRQAIAHAIDKQALLANTYSPLDRAANQWLPPTIWGHNLAMVDYEYDPELAADLLESANYPQAFSDPTITLEYRDVYRTYLRNPVEAAEAIQSQLQAVGLQVTIQAVDPAEMIDRVYAGEPEMFLLGWGADYPHPDNFFTPHFCTDFNLAFGGRDETFCASLEATLLKPDLSEQLADYYAAGQYVHDQVPAVPLANGRNMILIRSEVAGLEKASFVPESFRKVFWANGPNEIIPPDEPSTLEVSGSQVLTTAINIPAGAVSEEIVLSYALADQGSASTLREAPQSRAPAGSRPAALVPERVPPARMLAAAPQFQLSAYMGSILQPDLQFAAPVDIAIRYDGMEKPIGPETLALYFWDGAQWKDASTTCTPKGTPSLDTGEKTLHVPVCSTGIFGLFGKVQIFIPAVNRVSGQ